MTYPRITLLAGALAAALASCADSSEPSAAAESGRTARDSRPDGLFADFLDGKYDSAGHPFGAAVVEAESACEHDTGMAEAEGWAALADKHAPGILCRAKASAVGKGVFTVSVRALSQEPDAAAGPAVLSVKVRDLQGAELGSKEFMSKSWPAMTWQNLAVRFSMADAGPVSIEVAWSGGSPVRIDYLEMFRSERQLVLSPASGVLAPGAQMQFEFNDPPTGSKLEADCDGVDQTQVLTDLIAAGKATKQTTDFRLIVTAPADALLAACNLPSRFKVKAVAGDQVRATSRVSYRLAPIECAFEPGKVAVLLTGFEPFPADSTSDNSAERAVKGFDASSLPQVSVMRMILPVEYDAAPGWVADAIERCKPDVIVGFGQGRCAVDLETTSYNLKDTAEVSGGVPDNRGVIYGGDPIVEGGPAQLSSLLPVDKILAQLQEESIDSGLSDDPGRYVCNNLFYTIMTKIQGTGRIGGFVHLPRMHSVDPASQAMLQKVVTAVVEQSAAVVGGR
ncbi:MAG: hypothetical protein HY898_02875 [Deltaproteobacteria bacterium]|nr:hypothetical protein [Deltaproteobacteria bacterium]